MREDSIDRPHRKHLATNRKRAECEPLVRAVCRDWLADVAARGVSSEQAHFQDFYLWLSDRHPEYLRFKPSACVPHWVNHWFDDVSGRNAPYLAVAASRKHSVRTVQPRGM